VVEREVAGVAGRVAHAPHGGRALGVEQVVIGVGAGERDDQWDLEAPRQPQRQRPRAIGVEGMDHRRALGLHVAGDGRLGNGRGVPDAGIDPALAQPAHDAADRDRVAPDGGRPERRQDGEPAGHQTVPPGCRGFP